MAGLKHNDVKLLGDKWPGKNKLGKYCPSAPGAYVVINYIVNYFRSLLVMIFVLFDLIRLYKAGDKIIIDVIIK
jgi:hypothetical protein